MALCAGCYDDGWQFALAPDSKYEVLSHGTENGIVNAEWRITMPAGNALRQKLTMDNGVCIVTESDGLTGLMLPAFRFDGAEETVIEATEKTLSIHYQGWVCRYTTDGSIADTGAVCSNRNGQYQIFRAEKEGVLSVSVTIEREEAWKA
jgi:hypothetical protein